MSSHRLFEVTLAWIQFGDLNRCSPVKVLASTGERAIELAKPYARKIEGKHRFFAVGLSFDELAVAVIDRAGGSR